MTAMMYVTLMDLKDRNIRISRPRARPITAVSAAGERSPVDGEAAAS